AAQHARRVAGAGRAGVADEPGGGPARRNRRGGDRGDAGDRAYRRRDGAAAVHRLELQLYEHGYQRSDGVADISDLLLRRGALRAVAFDGVGGDAGPGRNDSGDQCKRQSPGKKSLSVTGDGMRLAVDALPGTGCSEKPGGYSNLVTPSRSVTVNYERTAQNSRD